MGICEVKIKSLVLFILLWLTVNSWLSAQPDLPNPPSNLQTATAGSLVIPMDNVNQAIGTPFNLKAYGLVNALLQNNIPVKWVIKSGKLKDGIDFSASAQRIYPTALPAAMTNFVASEFIIDSAYVNHSFYGFGKTATQVITGFGGNVAVFSLTANVTVDVRYVLNQHPKIAVFNNGSYQSLQSEILDSAGIPDYVDISAGVFGGLSACYTFCSEGHWDSENQNDTAITNRVRTFVNSGGNFFGQCVGVNTYEKYELFQSTTGTNYPNPSVTNAYYNNDMAFMQFMATVVSNESGVEQNWVRNAGSVWKPGFYFAISPSPKEDTIVAGAAHITAPLSPGGNIFYLGGHNYFSGGTADWNNLTHINAARLYLNAALIPSGRPTAFVAQAGSNTTICTGKSVVLGGTPTGPAGATYIWQPGKSLNDSTASNPVASPTVTTTYVVNINNGGCPQASSVLVTVNPLPIANAGTGLTVCPGNPSVILNGSVTNATGGVWSGGLGTFSPGASTLNTTYTPSAAEISSGSLTLTLSTTGMANCAATSSQVKITITPPLTVLINPVNLVCFGQNATLTASPAGGTPPYSYSWSSGETTQTITNKPAGSYTVTITDATKQACTKQSGISYAENPQLLINTTSSTVATCGATTNISAGATGGAGSYTYDWSTGQNSQLINVHTGTYTITITDGAGCTVTDAITVKSAVNGSLSAAINAPATACYGGGSSAIAAVVSGGFGNYTYSWNTGETVSTITKPKGTYCLTVKDSAGCICNACVTIAEETQIHPNIAAPLICIGSAGPVSSLPSGGTSPYLYNWSTGATSPGISQPAGTYFLTVTDANINACTATAAITVLQSPALSLTTGTTPATCNGGGDGSASVSVIGGTAPFSYSWSPAGGLGTSTTPVSAGIYSVMVTDKIGCTTTEAIIVSEPTIVSPAATSTNQVSCFGGSNGSAVVSASGGNPGYLYSWSTGSTSATVNGLSMATYIVTVTDSKGCSNLSTVAITQPAIVSSELLVLANVSCKGGNNGSAFVNATGGNGGFTYLWGPSGGTASTGTGMSAGSYTVTVTDLKGCTGTSGVTLTEPPLLGAVASTAVNVNCFGTNTGSASVSASGGKGAYTYSWSPSGGSGVTAKLLAAGTYTVFVTDDNGCTKSQTTTVTQPPQLLVIASPTAFITCSSTVVINAIAGGGTGTYSYFWNNGTTVDSFVTVNTGHYFVIVTDAHNCTAKDTVSVIALNSTLAANVTGPAAVCTGGTTPVSVNVNPGVGPYTYSWNTGETTPAITAQGGTHCATVTDNDNCKSTSCINIEEDSISNISVPSDTICFGAGSTLVATPQGGIGPYSWLWNTGETISTVIKPAGTYSVTISDATNCSLTASVTVVQSKALSVSFATDYNVSCFGGNNGIAIASVTGGKPNYFFKWTAQDTLSFFEGLTAGNYTVTVQDQMGCTTTGITAIQQPSAALNLTELKQDILCFGLQNGSATILASGGTTPYHYSWITSGDTVSVENNLSAGSYYAYVTDQNNCFASQIVVITQPGLLSVNDTMLSSVSCNGAADGIAMAVVKGGTSTYTYSWSIPGASGAIAGGLTAGTYSVTVTDAHHCTANGAVLIQEPPPLVSNPSHVNILCQGGTTGTASVSASGGNGTYSYTWIATGQTGSLYSNLSAGVYTVQTTDSKGCMVVNVITITEPPALTVNGSSLSSTCGNSNGEVMASFNGGVPPFTYSWTSAISGFTNSGLSNSGSSISGLAAGNYTVSVSDANLCTSGTQVILMGQSKVLVDSVEITNVSCKNGNNGSAIAFTSSGTGAYTYNWLPSGGTAAISGGLPANTYTLTIQDANGCQTTTTVLITEPAVLTLASTVVNVTCNGAGNGTITALPSGGTAGYSYYWSPGGATVQTLQALSPGTYTVFATDANDCSTTESYSITEPQAIVLHSISNNVKCKGACDGQISLTGTGGTGTYTYTWSSGSSGPGAAGLCPGNYCFTVLDANACTSSNCAQITEPPALAVSLPISVDAGCFGKCNGSASVNAYGGTAPYLYSWSSGQSKDSISAVCAGNYSILITDAENCTDTVSVNIKQPTRVSILADTALVQCLGNTTLLSAAAIGGSGSYTYTWQPLGPLVAPVVTTTYTVTADDLNGCSSVAVKIQVIVNPPPTIAITGDTTLACVPADIQFTDNSVAGSSSDPITSWYWNFGDGTISTLTNPKYVYTQPGVYEVTLTITSAGGCSSNNNSVPFIIHADSIPKSNFTTSPSVTPMPITNPVFDFTNLSSGAVSYFWSFGDGAVSVASNPDHHYAAIGVYEVKLISVNKWGCTDTFKIQTHGEGDLVFPNAFTPNANGPNGGTYDVFNTNNNVFFPFVTGVENFHMLIFNRWGEIIFETFDVKIGWDGYYRGHLCQQDVYVWKANVNFIDGRSITKAGDVTLLR